MNGLLKNKVFISTRPAGQSDELARLFSEAGATLLEMPLIDIYPATLSDSEKNILRNINDFHWLVFTSPNGIRHFFKTLEELNGNVQLPGYLKIAVIGNKTEKVLNQFGYSASFSNPGSTGEDFSVAFYEKIKNENPKLKVLLALGNLARTVIQDHLADKAVCTRIDFYCTITSETVDNNIIQRIKNNQYEMLLFTSPSGINGFLHLAGNLQKEKIRMACIGETTSKTALENNIKPLLVAKNSTATGLFECILNYYKKQ